MSAPAIELRNLAKAFGSCVANADVSLVVRPGSIHGVIGENGAGKSTAMKMLYGMYPPDSGEIVVNGAPRRWRSPFDAIEAGIGMVHQHFMLAGPYTALENIVLGAEPRAKGGLWNLLPRSLAPIDRKGAREKLERLSRQYGLEVDLDAPVEELPVGVQQRIEILKLLYRDAQVLILDEPTAVLTPQETEELFANLRKLRDQGKTILIITHKLKEVMSLTDRVTVFRAGRVTGEVETRETDAQELANLMVGRKVILTVDVPPQPALGPAVAELRNLSLRSDPSARPELDQVSFEVRSGEVVGIAGVEGNGQSELLDALFHPSDPSCRTSGDVKLLGTDVCAYSTDEIRDLGVAMIPEDRHKQALLLEKEVRENFLLGLHRRAEFRKAGAFIAFDAVDEQTRKSMEEYDVRPRSLEIASGRMSGGNQQKLIIAREFHTKPKFLIAAQPTRGVDVGAIEFIHTRILEARTSGVGVLLVSSELDEVLALSDRILVMYEGKIVAEYLRGQVDERELGMKMGGAGGVG